MVCFDQWGPLELRPYAGAGWYPQRPPQRHRATYKRTQGGEQLLAFYAVPDACRVGPVRQRKTHQDLLAGLARLRTCYAGEQRIYLVRDHLNTPRHPLVRAVRLRRSRLEAFYAAHHRAPVWTPTYASWLNALEAQFGGVRKFAIKGADDPTHEPSRRRLQR